LHLKLLLVVAIGLAWAGFSLWLSLPWIDTLGESITMPLAIAVIFGIAIIPGYLNANLIASLLLDRPPPLRFDLAFPEATVVIACFNEEETIEGLREHGGTLLAGGRSNAHAVLVNFVFPYVDVVYSIAFDQDRSGPLRQLRDHRADDAGGPAAQRRPLADHVPPQQAILRRDRPQGAPEPARLHRLPLHLPTVHVTSVGGGLCAGAVWGSTAMVT
jgi:hypothetical protein